MYKYFYSWWILPVIILHDLLHIVTAYILGVKMVYFKFFRKNYIPNIEVKFEHTNLWKTKMISYSPIMFILCGLYPPLFIYLVTTIVPYKGNFICPWTVSENDINCIKMWWYYEYIISMVGEENFNKHFKNNTLKDLVKKEHLLTIDEYRIMNKNI